MEERDPSDDAEDLRLLGAWREGDSASGNELVRRHFPRVSRFFRRKVEPGARADLIQRAFLGCVESRDRVPEGVPFRVYLLGIAMRILADHLRRRRRRPDADAGASGLVELGPSPSGQAAARQEQRLLLLALRRVDLDLQIVLELHYWEHLATAEIGQVLDIPAGTVKSRLFRAREQLRARVAELAPSEAVAASTVGDLERWARSLRRHVDALEGPGEESEKKP